MRAAVCNEYGPPELLRLEELPDPVAQAGEVVVDVAAAAVNFPDLLFMANKYQVSIPTPFIPGSEFAGVVSAVADDVTTLAVGDHVRGGAMAGAFAERVSVPAESLTLLPREVDLVLAAAFWVGHATAYHSLRSSADVQPGELVLVLGAAGGVGLAAVELATKLGARVIACASTEAKLEACRAAGAEFTINYATDDLRAGIREISPSGVNVVIDPVGGPTSELALRSTAWGGRFVTIGFASGEIPRIPLNLVLLKGVIITSFEFRTFAEHAPEHSRRDQAELRELFLDGDVKPHLGAVVPLSDIVSALRVVADRGAIGKVVITM